MPAMTATPHAPARVSLITLGVEDVARSTDFYLALGWPLSPASVPGEVSFFRTSGGLLALYAASALAADTGLEQAPPGMFRGVTTAVNCDDAGQVDAALEAAVAAGGVLTRAAQRADWGGYVGYFADPDGHVWEVAHNPGWPIGEDGRPQLP
jgi:predicted lactoylglutathione lyase